MRVRAAIVLEYHADDADTAYRKAEDVMDMLRHDPDLASVYGDDRGDGYITNEDDEWDDDDPYNPVNTIPGDVGARDSL